MEMDMDGYDVRFSVYFFVSSELHFFTNSLTLPAGELEGKREDGIPVS